MRPSQLVRGFILNPLAVEVNCEELFFIYEKSYFRINCR